MLLQHRSSAHMSLCSGIGAATRNGSRIAVAAAKRSPLHHCCNASTRTPAANLHAAEAEAADLPETMTITRPDDWHLHVRDGDMMAAVLPHTAATFGRAIIMPNLQPPVTDVGKVIWPLMYDISNQPTRIAVLRHCNPHVCCCRLKQVCSRRCRDDVAIHDTLCPFSLDMPAASAADASPADSKACLFCRRFNTSSGSRMCLPRRLLAPGAARICSVAPQPPLRPSSR